MFKKKNISFINHIVINRFEIKLNWKLRFKAGEIE